MELRVLGPVEIRHGGRALDLGPPQQRLVLAALAYDTGRVVSTEALIGREGVVTHDIETSVGAGRVNVQGQDWAARSVQPIPAGTRIRVVGADGIILEVSPT